MTGLIRMSSLLTVALMTLMMVVALPAFSATQAVGESSVPAHVKAPLIDDGVWMLGPGRQVYSDLQTARQAALNQQAAPLRMALERVRQELARLNLPQALAALNVQIAIITNNLADMTVPVDAVLWLPIDTELERVSLYLLPQNRAPARAAFRAGRIAAEQGDRAEAGTQLKLLVSFLHYDSGAFPLQRVRADIQSAWSSTSLPQPYWKGALEAVQSALGEIHWVTGVNAGALLSAYRDAVNAYVLWPQRRQAAINYLASAQQALSTLPDADALAADAQRLIKKNNLGEDDLKQFIADIGLRIDSERAAVREKLLKQLGNTKLR